MALMFGILLLKLLLTYFCFVQCRVWRHIPYLFTTDADGERGELGKRHALSTWQSLDCFLLSPFFTPGAIKLL